jgi:hypothetical protein
VKTANLFTVHARTLRGDPGAHRTEQGGKKEFSRTERERESSQDPSQPSRLFGPGFSPFVLRGIEIIISAKQKLLRKMIPVLLRKFFQVIVIYYGL